MLYYGQGDDAHPGMWNWTLQIRKVIRYLKGRGLDVGSGERTIVPRTITADLAKYARGKGSYHVVCHGTWLPFKDRVFDYVFSYHCLEHIEDTAATLTEWTRVSKQWVVVLIPDARYIDRIGSGGEDPTHKHDFEIYDIFDIVREGKIKNAEIWELGYTMPHSSIYFVLRRIN